MAGFGERDRVGIGEEEDIFHGLDESTLAIDQHSEDDLFLGAGRRRCFYRAPGQEDRLFVLEAEVYLFSLKIRQYLRTLLQPGERRRKKNNKARERGCSYITQLFFLLIRTKIFGVYRCTIEI